MRLVFAVLFLISIGQARAVDVDTFADSPAQTTTSAVESVAAGAIGGVRNINTNISGFNEISVGGGTVTCRTLPAGPPAAQCNISYDGMNDGLRTVNDNGLMSADLVPGGQSQLSVTIDAFTGDSGEITFQFVRSNFMDPSCDLTTGSFSSTGTINIPFSSDPDCAAAMTDVGGIQISILITGTDSLVTFSMFETTPVDLMEFRVD